MQMKNSLRKQIQQNKNKLILASLLVATMTINTMAMANVVISGTRVIYPEKEREVTVRLDNRGELPSLVQAWIDDGNKETPINQLKVPFVINPAIFRMEASKGQTLRIAFTGASLPADKESIFWLNVLDIPPESTSKGSENMLQMALRSRIKLFYRPAGLDSDGALSSIKTIRWSLVARKNQLLASNPSPYFVNMSAIIVNKGKEKLQSTEGGMVPPGGNHIFSFSPSATNISKGDKVQYAAINDYGGDSKEQATIN